jgi:hypothetical protein
MFAADKLEENNTQRPHIAIDVDKSVLDALWGLVTLGSCASNGDVTSGRTSTGGKTEIRYFPCSTLKR